MRPGQNRKWRENTLQAEENQQCTWAFCDSVSGGCRKRIAGFLWVMLAVVLTNCKNTDLTAYWLSVRLSWSDFVSKGCRKRQWVFCAVLSWSDSVFGKGKSSGLSVTQCWRRLSPTPILQISVPVIFPCVFGRPFQITKGWGFPSLSFCGAAPNREGLGEGPILVVLGATPTREGFVGCNPSLEPSKRGELRDRTKKSSVSLLELNNPQIVKGWGGGGGTIFVLLGAVPICRWMGGSYHPCPFGKPFHIVKGWGLTVSSLCLEGTPNTRFLELPIKELRKALNKTKLRCKP